MAGGVQYKCPNCGAIVSRTTIKCPRCDYKIDFKEDSKSVDKLIKLLDKNAKDEDGDYHSEDICTVLNTFNFPLNAQEMLELCIYALPKIDTPICHPEEYSEEIDSEHDANEAIEWRRDAKNESKAWLNLIKKIENKALLMAGNKDIVNAITDIKQQAESAYRQVIERSNKLDEENKKQADKFRAQTALKYKIEDFFNLVINIVVIVAGIAGFCYFAGFYNGPLAIKNFGAIVSVIAIPIFFVCRYFFWWLF